jgi:hypothetical protein
MIDLLALIGLIVLLSLRYILTVTDFEKKRRRVVIGWSRLRYISDLAKQTGYKYSGFVKQLKTLHEIPP